MNIPAGFRSTRNLRFGLIPIALLVAILTWRFTAPVEARVRTLDRGPVYLEVRGTGTLESVQEVPLAFKVGGRIQDLPLDEGSLIHVGQVLGRLDPSDWKEQLTMAEAGRGVAEAFLGKAQADLEQSIATRQRARSDFERVQRLFEQGILSKSDLDLSQERVKVAEAGAKATEAARLQASRGESVARGTEAIQRINYKEVQLLSPVDGILTRRLREPGNIISGGTPVLTVASTRKLWVRTWVDEAALGSLRIGQPARVELRSSPGKGIQGRVDRIGRQSDRQTHELLVDVELLEAPPSFALGQRADVRIQASGVASTLRLPMGWAERDGSVVVERKGRVTRVKPVLGFQGSDFVEVKEGLDLGETLLRPAKEGGSLGSGRRVRRETT